MKLLIEWGLEWAQEKKEKRKEKIFKTKLIQFVLISVKLIFSFANSDAMNLINSGCINQNVEIV